MTPRTRADVAALPVRRAHPDPILEAVERVGRGDKVIRLPDRLTAIETAVARLTFAVVGLAVVLAMEGFPQALAALKTLGLL